jgi:hypothetical protein
MQLSGLLLGGAAFLLFRRGASGISSDCERFKACALYVRSLKEPG